jgi:hypothetical protein
MKKISTLFKKDPNDLGRVINEINPENNWVFTDEGVKATRKYDGTACAIINGQLYKRYDVKKGKTVPEFAIPCQEPDHITGHWPHWILCQHDNPGDKWHFEALNLNPELLELGSDGTYELCGPKIQGNPEGFSNHVLIPHGDLDLDLTLKIYDFESFRKYLSEVNIEGIVFHHPDGRMCKLRKSDYGIKR